MSQEELVVAFTGRWWDLIDRVGFPGMTVAQFVAECAVQGFDYKWDEKEVRPIWNEELIDKPEVIYSGLSSHLKVKDGWVLEYQGKYWGEVYPGDGRTTADMGWTDDLTKIRISGGKDKPPHKGWFTYANSPYIQELQKGEWVYVVWEQTTTLKPGDLKNG